MMIDIDEKTYGQRRISCVKAKRWLRVRRIAALLLFILAAAGSALSENEAAQDAAARESVRSFGSVGGYLIIAALAFLLGIVVALAGIRRREMSKKDGNKR